MLSILEDLMQGVGASTSQGVEYANKARDAAIGTSGAPELGGLLPALDTEKAYRDQYLERFNLEKNRITGANDANNANQTQINDLALGQLPGLQDSTTPEGYAARVGALAGDPLMQRIIDRQNQQRQQAATAQLSAGGLQRSGAAAQAGADATLTYDEFAMQKENQLYGRANDQLNRYKPLDIANMMVPDTLQRDLSIADNLAKQGLTRAQTELLKGQIKSEAAETLLTNLTDLIGAIEGGKAPGEGLTGMLDQFLGSFGDLIGDGADWIGGVIGSILDGVLGTGDGNGTGGTGTGTNTGNNGGGVLDGGSTTGGTPTGGGGGGTSNPVDPYLPPAIIADIPGIDFPDDTVTQGPVKNPDLVTPDNPTGDPWKTPEAQAAVKAAIEKGLADGSIVEDGNGGYRHTTPAEKAAILASRGGGNMDNGRPSVPGGLSDITINPGDVADVGTNKPDIDGSYGGGGNNDDVLNFNGAGNLPGLGTAGGIANAGVGAGVTIGGNAGQDAGGAIFGTEATQNYGQMIGAWIGSSWGPAGAVLGSMLGGIVDAAVGTSDQKNITMGVSTTPANKDKHMSQEITTPSGMKLYTIATRVGDEAANNYAKMILGTDQYMTDVAKASGFDIKMDAATFGGGQEASNFENSDHFFGSATEGAGESSPAAIERNMENGIANYARAYVNAAIDQVPPEIAKELRKIDQDAPPYEVLNQYANVMLGLAPGATAPARFTLEDSYNSSPGGRPMGTEMEPNEIPQARYSANELPGLTTAAVEPIAGETAKMNATRQKLAANNVKVEAIRANTPSNAEMSNAQKMTMLNTVKTQYGGEGYEALLKQFTAQGYDPEGYSSADYAAYRERDAAIRAT